MSAAAPARDLTGDLVKFAAATPLAAMPDAARTMGKHMLANAIALASASAHDDPVERAFAVVETLRTPPQATILGRSARAGAGWAALVNGIAVHAQDFDDTHLATVLHPSAPIVPAALAAAEYARASGRALLEAVVLGAEVAIRVALGLSPQLYDRGWHVTSAMGHLGAAIAAARAFDLDETRMRHALGIAATQATGLSAANGTMTKAFHPGKAALDGVEAAALAKEGFTSAPHAIEGRRGLAAVLVGAADYDAMLAGLGERWEVTAIAFKPYACGVLGHGIIDAALRLRQRVSPAQIARVEARVHPATLGHMGIAEPRDGLESKFSARHCAAVGFVDGAAGPRQFSDARACAPEIAAFRRRVTITADAELRRGAAIVSLETASGMTLREEVQHASGSAENPMTPAQLAAKAKLLAGEGITTFLAALDGLEALPSVEALLARVPLAASVQQPQVSQ
jgi:2-methylcitrate dehydratase PrpD